MAVDKLVDSTQLDTDLTSVANAIRTKGGTSAQLAFPAGFVSAIDAIPTGGASNWTLIGTKTLTLAEYTSTTAENTDTEIDIHNTDYAWLWVSITCDSAITTNNEWGMTQVICGRRSNGKISAYQATQTIGWASLSYAALVNNTTSSNGWGVYVVNDNNTVFIGRKCHTSNCPKIRAGNYTVKVYGLSSL